jgi:hypothetical protein
VPRPVFPRLRPLAAAAAIGAALVSPSAAQAHRAFFGFGFGFPGFYAGPPPFFYAPPPPVYVPPPVYYLPPPPVTYLPPPAVQAPAPLSSGARCYAGDYVCPSDRLGPAGSPCSCPTNTGRARGRLG